MTEPTKPNCEHCAKVMPEPRNGQRFSQPQRYCSRDCGKRANRKRRRAKLAVQAEAWDAQIGSNTAAQHTV